MDLRSIPLNWKVSKQPIIWALVTLFFSVSVTLFVADFFDKKAQKEMRSEFEGLVAEKIEELHDRFNGFEYGLRGFRSLIIALGSDPNTLDQDKLSHIFTGRNLLKEFHGSLGVGIVYKIPLKKEEEFIKHIRKSTPTFQIRQFTPHSNDRWPITHIYPLKGNESALGLDISSEANRERALLRSIKENKISLTEPITLVQRRNKINHGFLLMLPFYKENNIKIDYNAKTAAGVVYIPIGVEEIFGDLSALNESYTLVAESKAQAVDQIIFYQSPKSFFDKKMSLSKEIKINMYGQEWTLKFNALPILYKKNKENISVIYIIGLLLSIIISVLVLNLISTRKQYLDQLIERSSLGVIFDSSQDALVRVDEQLFVTAFNVAAEKLFEVSSKEALGSNIIIVLKTIFNPDDVAQIIKDIALGVEKNEKLIFKSTQPKQNYLTISTFPVSEKHDANLSYALVFRDYTARMQAENEVKTLNQSLELQVKERTLDLEQSRRDLQIIFDAAPSLIGYWDANQNNRFANKAYISWFGKKPEDIKGGHISVLLGKELYDLNLPYILGVLNGEPQKFERVIKQPDGKLKHTLSHYLPDIVHEKVVGFYAIIHDVTELVDQRKKLTDLISENEVLLGTINQHLLYSVASLDGKIIDANETFSKLSGYSRNELIGSNHHIVNSGFHPKSFWKEMWQTVCNGKSWRAEVCNRSKTGQIYWVDTVIAPHLNADGKVERLVSLRSDITHRKLVEEEYKRLTQLLLTVLSVATELSIIATDKNGLIKIFNAGAERMLEYSAEELIDKQTPAILHKPLEVVSRAKELSVIHKRNIEGFNTFIVEAEQYGKESREWTYVTKSGKEIPVNLTVTVIRDDVGGAIGYLGVSYDISQRLRYENELLNAKLTAEKANIAKSEFLANMSHEIRTPMNGILGMTYLLKHQNLPKDSLSMIDKIISSGDLLLRIINDILDYSRIESNAVELTSESFDLKLEIERIFEMIKGSLYNKPVSLKLSRLPSKLPMLSGDTLRLGQILINILGNSAKFTSKGEIVVSVKVLERDDDNNKLLLNFSIRDTGIGIPKNKLESIFEPFTQEDSSTSKRFGGTGLGLAITAKLVRLMGGTIHVESEVDCGTVFTVILPFDIDTTPLNLSLQHENQVELLSGKKRLQGINIFVVDDSEINREVAYSILKREGAEVIVADDGESALELLDSKPSIDIILMDVQMPIIDGYVATSRIKEINEYHLTPVIALTAGVLQDQRDKALAAGMCDFVGKPFNVDNLVDVILKNVASSSSEASIIESKLLNSDDGVILLEQALEKLKNNFTQQTLPERINFFQEVVKLGNVNAQRDAIVASLHKLAGEAGMVGFESIGNVARQLEQDICSGEISVDHIQNRLESLLVQIQSDLLV